MARVTGLEPATSGVTGRRSNQLSYTRVRCEAGRLCARQRQVNHVLQHSRHFVAWHRQTFPAHSGSPMVRDLPIRVVCP